MMPQEVLLHPCPGGQSAVPASPVSERDPQPAEEREVQWGPLPVQAEVLEVRVAVQPLHRLKLHVPAPDALEAGKVAQESQVRIGAARALGHEHPVPLASAERGDALLPLGGPEIVPRTCTGARQRATTTAYFVHSTELR